MNKPMPSGTPSIIARISTALRVHIVALQEDFEIDQPVYALNWFNTRWLWLYNFYNFLAARSVFGVGGIPYFKARVTKILYGSSSDYRSVILVVRYPDIKHFQKMLESRYFQVVSIIRTLTVFQFTFGLSTRTDIQDTDEFDDQFRVAKKGAYAIFHYRLFGQSSDIEEPSSDLASSYKVTIAFSSRVSARLYPQKGTDHPESVSTIMDGCLIMQAESPQYIEQLIASADFRALLAKTENSFVAVLKRIF